MILDLTPVGGIIVMGTSLDARAGNQPRGEGKHGDQSSPPGWSSIIRTMKRRLSAQSGIPEGAEKIGLKIANLRDNKTRQVLLIDAQSSKPLGLVNKARPSG